MNPIPIAPAVLRDERLGSSDTVSCAEKGQGASVRTKSDDGAGHTGRPALATFVVAAVRSTVPPELWSRSELGKVSKEEKCEVMWMESGSCQPAAGGLLPSCGWGWPCPGVPGRPRSHSAGRPAEIAS